MAIQTGLVSPRSASLGERLEVDAHFRGVHLVAAGHDDDHAAKDGERAERHHDRRDAEKGDERAVDQPEQQAGRHAGQDHQDERHVGIILADQRRDEAGQRKIRGNREVDAAGQDHHHLRQRHHEQHRGLGEQVGDVLPFDEDRLIERRSPRRRRSRISARIASRAFNRRFTRPPWPRRWPLRRSPRHSIARA